MPRSPSALLRVGALFSWVTACEVYARRHDRTVRFVARELGLLSAVLWSALLLATIAAIVALALSKRRRVAVVAFILAVSNFVTSLGFRGVNGTGFSAGTARLVAVEAGGYAAGAVSFHGARAIGYVILGVALMHVPRYAASRFITFRTSLVANVAALVVLAASLVGALVSPMPSWLPSFLAPTAFLEASVTAPAPAVRDRVSLAGGSAPLARHVVLIVDESIRGDLVSLSRSETATTPWLASRPDLLADYGVASSLTNCSASANAGLLVGLRREDVPDRANAVRQRPTIFAHAAKAGFRTAFLDAQSTSLAPPWALTPRDLEDISIRSIVRHDEPQIGPPFVDRALADRIVALTGDAPPTFIYANKRGAHYPYVAGVPENARNASVPQAEALGFANNAREAAEYLDAVTYAVDVFFLDLLKRLEGRDVLLVYLSDHGESLQEDGVSRTHCIEGPAAPEQGRIPLFVWMGDRSRAAFADFRRSAAALHDRAHALRVFPTLLVAFGYERSAVRAAHGPSLLDDDARSDDLRFFSGDLVGKGPFWWNRIH